MADRPLTLAEKLAAARAPGAAKPKDAEPPAEELLETAPEPEDIPAEAIEEESEVEEAPTPTAKPTLDRPLTMAEKLAAARSGGAPKPAVAKSAPKPKPAPAAAAPSEEESEVAEEPVPAPAPASRPAIPTDRPLTLAEKLAAARAASGAPAGAKPAAAKPAAAKPAASAAKTSPAAKAPARELPPLEKITDPRDLAEAARRAGAVKEKAVAAKEAPTKPAPAKKLVESKTVPAKPAKTGSQPSTELAAAAAGASNSRRGFFGDLGWVVVGWSSFAAGMAAMILGSLRFYFPNVLAEPPSTYKVGLPTTFEKESVDERFKAEAGFWIVRSANFDGVDKIYALSSICTHLGCPPNWLAGEQKFKCPCHGSGFYISGVNFEGPAPRPLERYKIAVGDDGQLVVDKSEKFQEELKQWVNPDSFIVA